MEENDINEIFSLYDEIINDALSHKDLFIKPKFYKLSKLAWENITQDKVIEDTKRLLAEKIQDNGIEWKMYGLSGEQWTFKVSIIRKLKELYDKAKDDIDVSHVLTFLKKILSAINIIFSSILSAIPGIPGIDLLKEFKDFFELSLKEPTSYLM